MTDKSKESKPAAMPAATTKAAASVKPAPATAAKAAAKPTARQATKPAPVKAAGTVSAAAAKAKPVVTKSAVSAKPAAKPSTPVKKPGAAETKAELAKAAQALATLGLVKGDAKPAKPAKARKAKLVRDSFTMPETEYSRIAVLKKRLLLRGRETKKSELLRAGLAMLAALDDAKLLAELKKVERVKTGRPPKSK